MILNAHTHNADARNAVINVYPDTFSHQECQCYSVGIHPWHTQGTTAEDIERVATIAQHPQVVAIGETGLDALQGASLERQMEIFKQHIAIAERVQKPLVIHMVRTSQQVLKAWKESHQSVRWAIHGMRGNERVAAPLIEAGFYLSFGERFNPITVAATPLDRILIETDDSDVDILQVAANVAEVLGKTPEEIIALAGANAKSFYGID